MYYAGPTVNDIFLNLVHGLYISPRVLSHCVKLQKLASFSQKSFSLDASSRNDLGPNRPFALTVGSHNEKKNALSCLLVYIPVLAWYMYVYSCISMCVSGGQWSMLSFSIFLSTLFI